MAVRPEWFRQLYCFVLSFVSNLCALCTCSWQHTAAEFCSRNTFSCAVGTTNGRRNWIRLTLPMYLDRFLEGVGIDVVRSTHSMETCSLLHITWNNYDVLSKICTHSEGSSKSSWSRSAINVSKESLVMFCDFIILFLNSFQWIFQLTMMMMIRFPINSICHELLTSQQSTLLTCSWAHEFVQFWQWPNLFAKTFKAHRLY